MLHCITSSPPAALASSPFHAIWYSTLHYSGSTPSRPTIPSSGSIQPPFPFRYCNLDKSVFATTGALGYQMRSLSVLTNVLVQTEPVALCTNPRDPSLGIGVRTVWSLVRLSTLPGSETTPKEMAGSDWDGLCVCKLSKSSLTLLLEAFLQTA